MSNKNNNPDNNNSINKVTTT
jgi:hypothetical protein